MSILKNTDSIAVSSRSFSENRRLREALGIHFKYVRFNETGRLLEGQEILDFLGDSDGAIVGREKIDNSVLNLLPKLKVISKFGVEVSNLDLEAMESRDIKLGWKGGLNRRSVAELTLGMMLLGVRRAYEANRSMNEGQWNPTVGRQLTGKTIGIIGCGRIGKEVVELLKPFDCKILSYDIQDFADFYRENKIKKCDLEELLSNSDVVSLHVPLTKKTKHLINEANIELLKINSVLINTAQGGIVQESALISRLSSMNLFCGFDVYENESECTMLVHYPTFFATPHIGGSTVEAQLELGEAAIRGLLEPMRILDLKHRNLLPIADSQ